MMVAIPLIALLGFFVLHKRTEAKSAPPTPTLTVPKFARFQEARGPHGGVSVTASGDSLAAKKHLIALKKVVEMGHHPPEWLIDQAIREAYESGDWKTVHLISHHLLNPGETPPPAQTQTAGENPAIVIGKSSPLQGVSNDEWSEFVEKLKTQKPDYADEKHVGAYHHNKDRLEELGISDVANEEAQYQALERDIADRFKSQQKLIQEYCGDHITINGETHPVTMSGILGVLKSAGPKNAQAWFRSEADRKTHPKTTEMFLRTNNLF